MTVQVGICRKWALLAGFLQGWSAKNCGVLSLDQRAEWLLLAGFLQGWSAKTFGVLSLDRRAEWLHQQLVHGHVTGLSHGIQNCLGDVLWLEHLNVSGGSTQCVGLDKKSFEVKSISTKGETNKLFLNRKTKG